ncbi:MAG: hypothetical protein ABL883_00075 [Terricaulis sp.]
MKKWLVAILLLVGSLGGFFWWAALDAAAPARADGVFALGAYRALVADDPAEALPKEIRVEFVGGAARPAFAVQAGAMGAREIAYTSFQIVAPAGDTIIDAPVDRAQGEAMTGEGFTFSDAAYERVLTAMANAATIAVTHEHADHVTAIARHPAPAAIAPHLALTSIQRDALAPLARGAVLAPAIAAIAPLSLSAPTRIAPGIVMIPAAGHSPASVVFYVKTSAREYLFIGDIAWAMSNITELTGRPRFLGWIIRGVDTGRDQVLAQIRALHDLAASEPSLVILPAHDAAYLRALVASGILTERFAP